MARLPDLPRMQNQPRPRTPAARNAIVVPSAEEPPPKPRKPRLMRQYELIERVKQYNPAANEDLLNRAYVYAMRAHGEQKRASGDPYFSHPLQVAAILTDLKLDDATIAAALLHDTIEDTDATRAEIDRLFGHDIGVLVEGLTKLKKLDLVSKEAKQAENLRKLLLAIADDVRVLLDQARRPAAQYAHAVASAAGGAPRAPREETLDIYAPLAGRMGMQEMREELEDLAFRELNPGRLQGHHRAARSAGRAQQRLDRARSKQQLAKKLADSGIAAEVVGPAQARLFDLAQDGAQGGRLRAAVRHFRLPRRRRRRSPNATSALGIVHTTWPVVPGRFKDYISTPKQNDYRSIHTTVIGPGKQRVELQIRTREMQQIAEYGIAAHALYKDGGGSPTEMLSRESRTPMPGCAAPSNCWPKAPTRKSFWSTPSSNCSTTRCSASRRRAS